MENLGYQWQRAFVAVLTEVNSEKFEARLTVADDAIFQRLLGLEGAAENDAERIALEDTLQDLRLLRKYSDDFRVRK